MKYLVAGKCGRHSVNTDHGCSFGSVDGRYITVRPVTNRTASCNRGCRCPHFRVRMNNTSGAIDAARYDMEYIFRIK